MPVVTWTSTVQPNLISYLFRGYYTFANLEMGGPDGAYIDMKDPISDDYDGRVIWDGSDMIVTTGATGNVILKKNNATRLQYIN